MSGNAGCRCPRTRRQRAGAEADRGEAAGGAQYTSDESQLVAERLRERGAKSLSVCSSAAHLPRAAEHYRQLGFEVVPRGMALAQVDGVVKEWMGRVVTSRTNNATHSNSNSQTPAEP